jgi:hypothetical protein
MGTHLRTLKRHTETSQEFTTIYTEDLLNGKSILTFQKILFKSIWAIDIFQNCPYPFTGHKDEHARYIIKSRVVNQKLFDACILYIMKSGNMLE